MKFGTEVLDPEDDDRDEDLDLEEDIVDENDDDEDSSNDDEDDQSDDEQDEEEDGFAVSFGDEADEEDEDEDQGSNTIKLLRKQVRKKNKRIKELERKRKEQETDQLTETVPKLPAKPTVDQFEKAEDFSTALDNWYEIKAEHEEATKRVEAKNGQIAERWNSKVTSYTERRNDLDVEDFEDMESLIEDTLSPNQQAMIVSGCTDPALFIYALGKNPKKAEELAALSDPVEFAFAAARMETQLKTSKRKRAPAPERRVRGRSGTVSTDNELERLEKEADKTGDRSKVVAYKRELRRKQG
jgi:hypothetical protein